MYIAYLRVSTETQAENGFGLDLQREAITAWAEGQGVDVDVWYGDEGVSGATLDRPGIQGALAALGEGDTLVVARLDRLSRDLLHQLLAERQISQAGARLVSVAEPQGQGSDATATLLRQVVGAVAEYERATIRARLTAGRRAKASQGGYTGGRPPYGYRAEGGALVVVPDEAVIVRRIARWHTRGLTLAEMARRLTASEGATWTATDVRRIITRREAYRGRVDGRPAIL